MCCKFCRILIKKKIVFLFYVCECTVGVDVGDGTTILLNSILSNIVMGCIVLGRQMNVDFGTIGCINTIDVCWNGCPFLYHEDPRQHDHMQPNHASIVVHLAVVQSCFCICTMTEHPISPFSINSHCVAVTVAPSSTNIPVPPHSLTAHFNTSTLVSLPIKLQTNPDLIRYSQFFKFNMLLVVHSKPTTYCRLILAFANKRNVAAGDMHSCNSPRRTRHRYRYRCRDNHSLRFHVHPCPKQFSTGPFQ